MILSLGAPLRQVHKDTLNRVLPNRLYELYGVTEGFITVLDRADAVRKAGSVGVPPPFYEMRILDEQGRDCPAGRVGEIVGRGPVTMAGYAGRDDLTAETCATAGCSPATWATSTTRATCSWSIARRT
jgi:acyl-CoA synthetase (AMP-forming)/AMP-acid ligase II